MSVIWYTLSDPNGPDWLAAAVAGLFFVVLPLVCWSVWRLRTRRQREARKRTARIAREQAPALERCPLTPDEKFAFRMAAAAAMSACAQEPDCRRKRDAR